MSYSEKLRKLEYPNQENSFLNSIISFFFSCEEFTYEITELSKKCGNPYSHYCLVCGISRCLEDIKINKIPDTSRLKNYLSRLYAQKAQFSEDQNIDLAELIPALLNSVHCYYINDRSEGIDDAAVNATCNERCPFHKTFYLGVKENYTCRCGLSRENDWEYNNFCQYFSADDVISEIKAEFCEDMLGIPNFMLNSREVQSNAVNFNQVSLAKLRLRLETADSDTCLNDNCRIKQSKINFSLTKIPKVFIFLIVKEDKKNTHLQALISTLSLSHKIDLKRLYEGIESNAHVLKGIIFYGRDGYEYAFRHGKNWIFKGLGDHCEWVDLVKEITIMNYFPVCAAYEYSRDEAKFEIEESKLIKLEKLAYECDKYIEKKGVPVIDMNIKFSGFGLVDKKHKNREEKKEILFEEKKIENKNLLERELRIGDQDKNKKNENVKGINYVFKPNEPHFINKFDDYDRYKKDINESKDRIMQFDDGKKFKDNLERPALVWECECKAINSDEWEICQKCEKIKPGVKGWLCNTCKFLNKDVYSSECLSCSEPKYKESTRQEHWKCSSCNTFNLKSYYKCTNCNEFSDEVKIKYGIKKPEVKADEGREHLENKRRLGNNYENEQEKEWVCKKCNAKNSSILSFCMKCNTNKVPEQTIENRKNYPIKNLNELDNKWVCKICDREYQNFLTICALCNAKKGSEKELIKEERKKWECRVCHSYNDDIRTICKSCNIGTIYNNESKNNEIQRDNQEKWKCLNCDWENDILRDSCMYCNKIKAISVANKISSKPGACEKCGNYIKLLVCPHCGRNTLYEKNCKFCNYVLGDVKKCYSCYNDEQLKKLYRNV